eukprot:gene491-48_t
MRIYISNADTHLGAILVKDLKRFGGIAHKVFATTEAPGVNRVFKRKGASNSFTDELLKCTLIVFDLNSMDDCDHEDLQKYLSAVQKEDVELEHDTRVVLLSSVGVWAGTENPTVEVEVVEEAAPDAEDAEKTEENDEKTDEKAEDQPQDGAAEGEEEAVETEKKTVSQPRPLVGSDYELRKPKDGSADFDKYSHFKSVEEQVLALNGVKENLKAYVVASGVQYGHGEAALEPAFKNAWVGDVSAIVASQNSNNIPMVHGSDVASMIQVLSAGKSEEVYHLALEKNTVSEKELLQAVVDTLSEPTPVTVAESGNDALNFNLNMAPSSILTDEGFSSAAPGGVIASMKSIAQEFCAKHNLNPIRVLITGETAADYASKISSHFNIPVVKGEDEADLKAIL